MTCWWATFIVYWDGRGHSISTSVSFHDPPQAKEWSKPSVSTLAALVKAKFKVQDHETILWARTFFGYSWTYVSKCLLGMMIISVTRWEENSVSHWCKHPSQGELAPLRKMPFLPELRAESTVVGYVLLLRKELLGEFGRGVGRGREGRTETTGERRCPELCHDWDLLNLQKVKRNPTQNTWCDCISHGNPQWDWEAKQLAPMQSQGEEPLCGWQTGSACWGEMEEEA